MLNGRLAEMRLHFGLHHIINGSMTTSFQQMDEINLLHELLHKSQETPKIEI